MSYLASLMTGRTEKLEQLSRLRQAKSTLETLQMDMVQHSRDITEPELPPNAWKGTTADKFEQKRDAALRSYKDISHNKMDDAVQLISSRMGALHNSVQSTEIRIEREKQRIKDEK
ncbi:DUF5082 family protein [Terribacillus sp. DMT04]|uniref:YwqH-like family protein n=1 Tax=Terribacillus sp. DMT04 TaxID=2850441 RepID=UPI001C2CB897|nr:DUF5082 family protein [Terribacillus sp. DMT04]QXE00986.1 DUF5082 domain-containing protein [Terribacillus sp. DMT04]